MASSPHTVRPQLVVPPEAVAEAIEDGLTRAAHLPAWIDATVALHAGTERFAVRISRGRPKLARRARGKPDLTISADAATLARVADGRETS